jgi:predicted enzyme related to lactoylglutathione lyase
MARVIHFELPIQNPERASAFYTTLFGWQVQPWGGPFPYWMVRTGDPEAPGIDGGLAQASPWVTAPVVTLEVDDIDATLAQVAAHGGAVVAPKMPIGDMGALAYFRDPEGNVVGLWESAK